MNNTRRTLCQSLISAISLSGISACSQPATRAPQSTYTEAEQRRMHKFRGVGGGEFFISGFGESAENGVFAIFRDAHGREIGGSGYYWKDKDRKSGNAPLISVNIEVFDRNGGKLLYQRHLQIADRIPDELLNDLRRDPKGTLRIKIRLHREGVLLGWDIERRPGYDPKKRNAYGNPIFVSAVHSFAGGDFREAEIINGQAVRKGWYIHPKTGQRIETDF